MSSGPPWPNQLLRFRREAGLTQKQVAEAVGLNPSGGYWLLEHGKHRPRRDIAELISIVVGALPEDIFPLGIYDGLDPDHKARMVEGRTKQQRAHAVDPFELDLKRCARCFRMTPIEEYQVSTRTLADGSVKRYPHSYCRQCQRDMAAERRRAMTPEQRERRRQQDALRRRTDAYREYQREWAAAKRRKEGRPTRGARVPQARSPRGKAAQVDATPLLSWVETEQLEQTLTLSHPTDDGIRVILSRGRKQGTLSEESVDKVLLHFGRPDMMVVLYPVQESTGSQSGD